MKWATRSLGTTLKFVVRGLSLVLCLQHASPILINSNSFTDMTQTTPPSLTFRALRLLADGEFRSGEELARTLGVSRTTVWKALQNLETWGVTLFKVLDAAIGWSRRWTGLSATRSSDTSATNFAVSDSCGGQCQFHQRRAAGRSVGRCAARPHACGRAATQGRGRRRDVSAYRVGGALTFRSCGASIKGSQGLPASVRQ
jgi:biotin operon repressor BirA-like protein